MKLLIKFFIGTFCFCFALAMLATCNSNNNKSSQDSDEVVTEPVTISENNAAAITIDSQLQSENGLPVVVDFYADWCGPCQQFKPTFHAAEKKYVGKIDFKSVNVDTDSDLANKYGINAIPTIIFFDKDGREINRSTGFVDEATFDNSLSSLLNN